MRPVGKEPSMSGSQPHDESKREPGSEPPRRDGLLVGLGVGLVAVGVPMLVLPGPGVLAIAAGAGMIVRGLGRRQEGKS